MKPGSGHQETVLKAGRLSRNYNFMEQEMTERGERITSIEAKRKPDFEAFLIDQLNTDI
jgi:hypothetical protein